MLATSRVKGKPYAFPPVSTSSIRATTSISVVMGWRSTKTTGFTAGFLFFRAHTSPKRKRGDVIPALRAVHTRAARSGTRQSSGGQRNSGEFHYPLCATQWGTALCFGLVSQGSLQAVGWSEKARDGIPDKNRA